MCTSCDIEDFRACSPALSKRKSMMRSLWLQVAASVSV